MSINRRRVVTGTVGFLAIGVLTPAAVAAPGSGVTTTTLVTANLNQKVDAHAFRIRLKTEQPTSVRVSNLVFAPGSTTGWHHHPGVVLVAVMSGAVIVWDEECNQTTYGPGQPAGASFAESGDDAMQVTSVVGGSVYATYIVPQATPPVFRIEANTPACALAPNP